MNFNKKDIGFIKIEWKGPIKYSEVINSNNVNSDLRRSGIYIFCSKIMDSDNVFAVNYVGYAKNSIYDRFVKDKDSGALFKLNNIINNAEFNFYFDIILKEHYKSIDENFVIGLNEDNNDKYYIFYYLLGNNNAEHYNNEIGDERRKRYNLEKMKNSKGKTKGYLYDFESSIRRYFYSRAFLRFFFMNLENSSMNIPHEFIENISPNGSKIIGFKFREKGSLKEFSDSDIHDIIKKYL